MVPYKSGQGRTVLTTKSHSPIIQRYITTRHSRSTMYTSSSSCTHEDGSYCFLPVDLVASHINCRSKSQKCIIVDVRPHREFMENHIKGAVHLHLNAMQLRRLAKGVSELETIIADERCKEVLKRRYCSDVQLVVYDDCSSEGKLLTDVRNYTTILQKGMKGSAFVLNGKPTTTTCRARAR